LNQTKKGWSVCRNRWSVSPEYPDRRGYEGGGNIFFAFVLSEDEFFSHPRFQNLKIIPNLAIQNQYRNKTMNSSQSIDFKQKNRGGRSFGRFGYNKNCLLLFVLICLGVKIYSQRFDTTGTKYFKDKFGENINNVDSNGLKQGLWVDYVEESSGHSDFGCMYDEFVSFKIRAFGHFVNDIKLGEWVYYTNFETSGKGFFTECYYNDRSVLEIKYDGYLSNYYNFDSSIIISTVFDEMASDTFCIECINKNKCILYSENIPLDTFNYTQINLFAVQQDVLLGGYRRLKYRRLVDEGSVP
jgi:hypothetical protein